MVENNFLLTGLPGCGKTTVIKKLAEMLGEKACGFYTAEVRSGNRRQGFEIVSLEDSQKALLAHVKFSSRHRVGKYGVDPAALLKFMEAVNRALRSGEDKCLLLDEIGKMEFFTPGFKEMVTAALDSPLPVVATIMYRRHTFCDRLKQRPNVRLIEVSAENREALPGELYELLRQSGADHSRP